MLAALVSSVHLAPTSSPSSCAASVTSLKTCFFPTDVIPLS